MNSGNYGVHDSTRRNRQILKGENILAEAGGDEKRRAAVTLSLRAQQRAMGTAYKRHPFGGKRHAELEKKV
ncbi:hypothetical protein GJ744_003548 [Endocarpon pusillum]|uniref:Uncharacterized protein n=1 Tax=Endocarpon pusillum TaxID=364733 RepID=A0A8H7APG3_9EURO|nr:hypothetical protein GJ744_003548 [Endocarpon pusillum]